MEENKRISDLFESARTEVPKIGFEEVKKHVLAASTVGGVGIVAKWTAASFKLKAIIMITLFSTLTISGILVASQLSTSTELVEVKADKNNEVEIEYIEISNEGGVKKTVTFNENDQVLEVLIDSTKKVSQTAAKIELINETPEIIQGEVNADNGLIKLKSNAPIILISTDSLNKKKFTITEKTTNEELESIAKQARAAGIAFDYSTRIRKNTIRKVKFEMKINGSEGRNDLRSTISGKTFSHDFGWWEDDDGAAIRFLETNKRLVNELGDLEIQM